MSLKLLQPGVQPLGQFDGLDAEALTLLGGEVVTLVSVLNSADLGAADVTDGYVGSATAFDRRVVVTKTLSSGARPLMLADEGIAGYGTLFGTVVGGAVGKTVTGFAVLGPQNATVSGKVTCWDKPGLFAVSLDAVDTTAVTGLVASNPTLDTGDKLYATTAGLLTPNTSAKFENVSVGRFVSLDTNGSLVTSQNYLVTALNSPTGSAAPSRAFTFATFFFTPSN
jgi:hypothetical protein